jgi:hypothetical protein
MPFADSWNKEAREDGSICWAPPSGPIGRPRCHRGSSGEPPGGPGDKTQHLIAKKNSSDVFRRSCARFALSVPRSTLRAAGPLPRPAAAWGQRRPRPIPKGSQRVAGGRRQAHHRMDASRTTGIPMGCQTLAPPETLDPVNGPRPARRPRQFTPKHEGVPTDDLAWARFCGERHGRR